MILIAADANVSRCWGIFLIFNGSLWLGAGMACVSLADNGRLIAEKFCYNFTAVSDFFLKKNNRG
jgi:hypothetical protein